MGFWVWLAISLQILNIVLVIVFAIVVTVMLRDYQRRGK